MNTKKSNYYLKNLLFLLIAVILVGNKMAIAENYKTIALPANNCYGTDHTVCGVYNGTIEDYRQKDILALLKLSSDNTWNEDVKKRMNKYVNSHNDIVVSERGRVYYIRKEASSDIDSLFSILISNIYSSNNNQSYKKEIFDLSISRETGKEIDIIDDEKMKQVCITAKEMLKQFVSDQDPYLLNIYTDSIGDREYTFLSFGFLIDGIPVYGLNETALNIVNPDETETAIRETAIVIYNHDDLCCFEIRNIMYPSFVENASIITMEEANNILNDWFSLPPNQNYTIHQCWLSEVPLGDPTREPLVFTPFWSFFLTWETDGRVLCATPRINAITGELLWW